MGMNLTKIFRPQTMAIIGVSLSNPFNPANVIYNKNRHHCTAGTYGVNPKGGELYGQRIYKSISEIPVPVDLAVISVKADFVPQVIRECIKCGVGGAIIISGGFTESGKQYLEKEIRDTAVKNDFPVIGPNCLGVMSYPYVDTFFLSRERLIALNPGNVSLISQSGGILVDQLIKLTQEGVGIARAVSIGNKAVLDEVDILEYLKTDRDTDVIGIYVEGFKEDRGRKFIETANGMKKPVIIIKSGKTPGGTRAVSSHTASIAGDYTTFRHVVEKSRAIEATSENEFVSFCEVLSNYPGKRVTNTCIITASGGHGAMASDGLYDTGIMIPEIPEDDRIRLKALVSENIRDIASFSNPVDLTGSAGDIDFVESVKFFFSTDYIDCVLLLLLPYLPGISTDIGSRISELVRTFKKPLVVYIPHVDKYDIFIEGFEGNGIPVAHSVEGAVNMVKAIAGEKI